jgi:hypothetical protein
VILIIAVDTGAIFSHIVSLLVDARGNISLSDELNLQLKQP